MHPLAVNTKVLAQAVHPLELQPTQLGSKLVHGEQVGGLKYPTAHSRQALDASQSEHKLPVLLRQLVHAVSQMHDPEDKA